MALIFADSFQNYATPAVAALGKYQSVIASSSSSMAVVSGGRNGANTLQVTPGGSANGALQNALSASFATLIVGFAIQVNRFEPSAAIPILQFLDTGTAQVTVVMLPNGAIRFLKGTVAGTTLATSTASVLTSIGSYFYLEFEITFNSSTGTITLHSEGNNVALTADSSLDTAPSGNNNANSFQIGFPDNGHTVGSNVASFNYNDLYVVTTSGGSNTTFLGDVRVSCQFPNGAGNSTEFTPNGAAQNWQCVDEPSEDGDATYVSSATVDDFDLYTKTATPSTTGPIFGIQLCAVARKDDSGGRSISNVVYSGSTEADQSAVVLTTGYAWYLNVVEEDPNTSSAWTKAGFDAAQIGVKVAA